MRMSNINIIQLFLILMMPLVAISSPVDKGDKEYELNFSETFNINKDAIIQFDTKHGNIRIKEGSQNKAIFDVTISTDANSQEDADEIFEAIRILFDDSPSSILVETDIDFDGGKGKSWWSNIFGGWNNSVSFQIDMDVTLPSTVALEVEHSFGDVIIPDMDNDLEIELKHGNGRFANINGNADVSIQHGKIKMGDVHNLTIECHHSDYTLGVGREIEVEISHSDLDLEAAESLELDARHSDFNIGKVGKMWTDSGHSDFEIESVDYANFETSFGDIEIDWLGFEGEFDLQHSGVDIEEISAEATRIEIEGAHSGVDLEVTHPFSLDYEGSHAKPTIRPDLDYSKIDDEGHTYRYVGKRGQNPKLHIEADLQHGSFRLDD